MVIGWDIADSPPMENYWHYIVDVRKEDAISAALNDVFTRFGKVDALVNCAGIFSS